MQTFQQRVLGKIEDVAHKASLKIHPITEEPIPGSHPHECTISYDYSNCGTVNIHRHDEVTPFARVHFNFQSGYYTLQLEVNGTLVQSQPGRKGYYDFYQKNNEPTHFFDAFKEAIK